MSALTRKLLRDLLHMKGQALAIALVVATGAASLVSTMSAADSLELSRDTYYDQNRFARVFASVVRAPSSLAESIRAIPGVAQVEPRVVVEVVLDVPGMTEPAIGRLVSIPERGRPALNDLHVRAGRYIEPGRPDEALVSEAFAAAHGLEPGDRIEAVMNGRERTLQIVGIALSPEYVYAMRGDWPDDERFGVFWVGEPSLAAAFELTGAFNDVTLSTTRGASEKQIIDRLDPLLAPYGALGAYGRDRQVSDRLLHDELTSLRNTAVIIPAIFLFVAGLLLHIALTRLVATQRSQIGTLKAFGYSNTAIAFHYLSMALVLVGAGTALGIGGGLWLGGALTRLYTDYFRLPVLALRITPATISVAAIVNLAAAALAVLGAVRRAAALPPAVAMQPEPPAAFRPSLLERWGLHRLFQQPGRMALRNLARRPFRAALSALGVAFAVAILVVGLFSEDAARSMIDTYFRDAQRDDAAITLVRPAGPEALSAIEHLDGVLFAEPFRAVPVTLHAGHREYHTALLGRTANGDLRRLVGQDGRVVALPPDGLVLTAELARILGVERGDRGTRERGVPTHVEYLTIEVLDGRRPTLHAPVVALVDELVGASAYMEIHALNRLLQEGPQISGAYVSINPARAGSLYTRLKRTPAVASVSAREATLRSFERTMTESLAVMRAVEVFFAVLIAFAVVYNNARIALAERSRELATLRVLGLTRREVATVLLGELAVLVIAAIPAGLALGYGLCWLVAISYRTDMFRIPLIVNRSTYAIATIVVLAAGALCALVVRRRVARLDLVGVLKTRD